jgi:hypothetical protein
VAFLQELLEDAANRVLGPEDVLSTFENSTLSKFCRYFLQERYLHVHINASKERVPSRNLILFFSQLLCVDDMHVARVKFDRTSRPLVTFAEEVVPFLEKVVDYCVLSMQNGRIPGPATILSKLFHAHSYLFSDSTGSSSDVSECSLFLSFSLFYSRHARILMN